MNIAIIPARGGSKRIPRKNIKDFCGRPMISYSIDAALESELFDKVIVSTDDEEIRDIAVRLGAIVPFMRDVHLSDDCTPTVPVIKNAIEECEIMGWQADYVACIYATAPFISVQDLIIGSQSVKSISNRYCFPVCEFTSPPQRALVANNSGLLQPLFPENELSRTQDLLVTYYDVGQFYWAHQTTWKSNTNIHANGKAIKIPKWRAVDIDELEDWDRAERLFLMNKVD